MPVKIDLLRTPVAPSQVAAAHFEAKMSFETDCWDVHWAFANQADGFVLFDVRSRELFDAGHVPAATHMPHSKITREALDAYPEGTLFVTYCAGPHCNGADKGALKIARLGRPVKLMAGGVEGWKDEGLALEAGERTSA